MLLQKSSSDSLDSAYLSDEAPSLPPRFRSASCFASLPLTAALNRPATSAGAVGDSLDGAERPTSPFGHGQAAPPASPPPISPDEEMHDDDWVELYGEARTPEPQTAETTTFDRSLIERRLSTIPRQPFTSPSPSPFPLFRPPPLKTLHDLLLLAPSRLPPLMLNALERSPPRATAPLPSRPSSRSDIPILFPSFASLPPSALESYLLPTPPPPRWSLAFYTALAALLARLCPPSAAGTAAELALAAQGRLLPGGKELAERSRAVLAHAPDKAKIRAAVRLPDGDGEGVRPLPREARCWVRVCARVVRWLWCEGDGEEEGREVSDRQAYALLRDAPPAVHCIVSEYADLLRIRALLARLEREVRAALASLSSANPARSTAHALLNWMNDPGHEERRCRLLCDREGRVRGEGEGERGALWWRWLVKTEKGLAGVRDLDEWIRLADLNLL